jgi:hypothetical protein
MSNFDKFADPVRKQFQQMAKGDLFVVDIDGDTLYQLYLDSFPEGTNPIFRERTEHDCSNCKHFIRRAGMLIDANRSTVWDKAAQEAPYPFNEVAAAMMARVIGAPVVQVFRTKESGIGAAKTRGMSPSGEVERWSHFHTGSIPKRFRAASPGEKQGEYRTTIQVFQRGLTELKTSALEEVLSLIDADNIYRGAEHRAAVAGFLKTKQAYGECDDPDMFVWTRAKDPATRFRNSVIGTLVQDLSNGMGLEDAVRAFETKVAPQNYKRTKSLITPGMVKEAMKTITGMGLETALDRRFARLEDINVRDVLWVDDTVQPLMAGGIGDMLMDHAQAGRGHDLDEERAKEVTIDDFLARVVPGAKTMELLLKGEHLGNFVSLTAPVHPSPSQLFLWNNNFGWSYAGNIADSIKERVKRAGGQVTGVQLRASLSWFNYDDLDIHIDGPGGIIFYGHKRGSCGGTLDVDMNAGGRRSRTPVENVVWRKVPDGAYKVMVHNYSHRETTDVGFVVEIENGGKLSHFNYPLEVRHGQFIHITTLHVKKGVITSMEAGNAAVTSNNVSQEKWGLKTEKYVRVNVVTLSPNHWGDESTGNKHTFFLLDGAKNDEPCRGIYNEFLHSSLVKHRKVFEVIGDKTKCQPTEGQLSGLGFSSTKRDSVVIKIDNQRLYRVRFGA